DGDDDRRGVVGRLRVLERAGDRRRAVVRDRGRRDLEGEVTDSVVAGGKGELALRGLPGRGELASGRHVDEFGAGGGGHGERGGRRRRRAVVPGPDLDRHLVAERAASGAADRFQV